MCNKTMSNVTSEVFISAACRAVTAPPRPPVTSRPASSDAGRGLCRARCCSSCCNRSSGLVRIAKPGVPVWPYLLCVLTY